MKEGDDERTNVFEVFELGTTIGRLQSSSRSFVLIFSLVMGVFAAVIAPSLFFFFSHMMETNRKLSDIENRLYGATIENLSEVTSPNYDQVTLR